MINLFKCAANNHLRGDLIKDDGDVNNNIENEQNRRDMLIQAEGLMQMILKSDEYRRYLSAKAKLEQDNENAYVLAELRQQQMRLHLISMAGEDVDEEIDKLDQLFLTYCNESSISEFLYAEERLSKLFEDIQQLFADKLDLWSEFEFFGQRLNNSLN